MYELCRLRRSEGYGVCFDERAVAVQSFWRKAPLSAKRKKKGSPEPFFFRSLSDLFLDLGGLAQTVTQIVQLRSANLAVTDSLDVHNVGRVNRENLLTADTVGDTAHGDGFLNAAMLLGNDGALENLNSLAGTFLDLDMNTNRIADVHFGQFLDRKSVV